MSVRFLVCYTATQLVNQLHQTRIQVVRSNKVARKRLTKSHGTPAMDIGHMNFVLKVHIRIRKYSKKNEKENRNQMHG